MFKRIDHVELVTKQPDQITDFYTTVLGFDVLLRERLERSSLGVPMTLTYLQLNNSGIEVISYEGAVVNPIPAKEHLGYRLIALEVDDMDKAAAYLNAKGVQITWGPRTGERYTRAEICDPDGNAIELRQWLRV